MFTVVVPEGSPRPRGLKNAREAILLHYYLVRQQQIHDDPCGHRERQGTNDDFLDKALSFTATHLGGGDRTVFLHYGGDGYVM